MIRGVTQDRFRRRAGLTGIVYAVLAVMGGFGLEHTAMLKTTASAADLPGFVAKPSDVP